MSNSKMKGLLKGLRYISQIFDNEKEPEMQIGFPTDVKHVAHIGWDGGPSVNQPSWMSEFKASPGFASAPLSINGEMKEDALVKWVSEDSSHRRRARGQSQNGQANEPDSPTRAPGSPSKDTEIPKPSRRRSTTGNKADESSAAEKTDKPKQRRSSKNMVPRELSDGAKPARLPKDPSKGNEPSSNLPDIPRKTRRKKTKEEVSTRSRSKARGPDCDVGSENGSVSKSNDSELLHSSSALSNLEESAEKEFNGIL
ncbi:hypothetical protein K2173_013701 [Erythroxylum novogranatense]|uniref:CRIB domain-containing protein n=1 Tax=Erythroxylum novogranatense TaxID=1862640 RepID=A0AAV8SAB7_9ROSI|nr:hypothetical protein K2173_013701 [Erythroxylum novogranatense]